MPAARDQPAEGARLRRLGIDVEGLGVVARGESTISSSLTVTGPISVTSPTWNPRSDAYSGRYRYGRAMRTRKLGALDVTVVGLGCNNFGGRIDEDGDAAVVDAALDAGVTFFDTADIYGNRAAARRCSAACSRGAATRSCSPRSSAANGRRRRAPRVARLHPARARRVAAAAADRRDRSLPAPSKRIPARRSKRRSARSTSSSTEGKIRAYRHVELRAGSTLERARRDRGSAYVSEQSEYSWLAATPRTALLATCERLELGFIPFFPLASGLLTGKVRRDTPPAEGTRLHGREIAEADLDKVERLPRGRSSTVCRCSTSPSAGCSPCAGRLA